MDSKVFERNLCLSRSSNNKKGRKDFSSISPTSSFSIQHHEISLNHLAGVAKDHLCLEKPPLEITRIELFKACQRERERRWFLSLVTILVPDREWMETHCAIKRGKRRRRAESIGKFAEGKRERERELGWWFLIVWKEWRVRRSRCSFTECIR